MTPADLRSRRRALGWTQAETAERLGVALRTYHRWEAVGVPRPVQVDATLRLHEQQPRPRGRPRKHRSR